MLSSPHLSLDLHFLNTMLFLLSLKYVFISVLYYKMPGPLLDILFVSATFESGGRILNTDEWDQYPASASTNGSHSRIGRLVTVKEGWAKLQVSCIYKLLFLYTDKAQEYPVVKFAHKCIQSLYVSIFKNYW